MTPATVYVMTAKPIPDNALSTSTALRLGEALFRFLAGMNDESDTDEFMMEDLGVSISSGFIEIDSDTMWDLQGGLEAVRRADDSS